VGDVLTAPTAMVCVWIAAVEVLLAVLLDVLSAKAKLSKAVENITMILRNIATLFQYLEATINIRQLGEIIWSWLMNDEESVRSKNARNNQAELRPASGGRAECHRMGLQSPNNKADCRSIAKQGLRKGHNKAGVGGMLRGLQEPLLVSPSWTETPHALACNGVQSQPVWLQGPFSLSAKARFHRGGLHREVRHMAERI